MSDHDERQLNGLEEVRQAPPASPAVDAEPAADAAAVPAEQNGGNGVAPEAVSWRTEAGRKGALRIHELIQHGKLYEQEHGLKSGRQRLRQLIEEGKRYEQEHGLNGGRRARGKRTARVSGEQLLQNLLQTVLRLAKPRVRKEVVRLLTALENTRN
jgi:hypothetical protein